MNVISKIFISIFNFYISIVLENYITYYVGIVYYFIYYHNRKHVITNNIKITKNK